MVPRGTVTFLVFCSIFAHITSLIKFWYRPFLANTQHWSHKTADICFKKYIYECTQAEMLFHIQLVLLAVRFYAVGLLIWRINKRTPWERFRFDKIWKTVIRVVKTVIMVTFSLFVYFSDDTSSIKYTTHFINSRSWNQTVHHEYCIVCVFDRARWVVAADRCP